MVEDNNGFGGFITRRRREKVVGKKKLAKRLKRAHAQSSLTRIGGSFASKLDIGEFMKAAKDGTLNDRTRRLRGQGLRKKALKEYVRKPKQERQINMALLTCTGHPKYKALREPTSQCPRCWKIWRVAVRQAIAEQDLECD